MKTKIELKVTTIVYHVTGDKEVSTMVEGGKLTVKECKELIPSNSTFISKEVTTDEFEVLTSELVKLRIEETETN